MSPFRSRGAPTIAVVVLVVLVLGALLVGRSSDRRDAADGPVADESTTTVVPSTATDPPSSSTSSTPTDATTGPSSSRPAPVIDPDAVAAAQRGGMVPVVVRLDVTPTGTDAERAAQVADAFDRLLATLPPGSFADVNSGYTVGTVPLSVDAAALDAMARSTEVTTVRASRTFVPAVESDVSSTASVTPTSTGATTTEGAAVAWAAGKRGAGTTIAVLDSGVDVDHPFLTQTSRTVWEGCFAHAGTYDEVAFSTPCPGGAVMGPSDAPVPGSAVPCPLIVRNCAHGTHVAGDALGGTGTPGTPISGIAPAANLVAANVFSYVPGCTDSEATCVIASDGDIINALQWVYNERATFTGLAAVNLSIAGGGTFTSACDAEPIKGYIDQLAAVGVATVVASGNAAATTGVSWPACVSTAIAVSAIDDSTGARAWFADVGPQVAVMAAGVEICSAVLPGTTGVTSCPAPLADGTMAYMDGTSMASPAVAGAIALLKADSVASSEWRGRLQWVALGGQCVSTTGYSIPRLRVDVALGLTSRLAAPCAPGTPTASSASATSATVEWRAPVSLGTGTLLSSTVTASTGQTCTATAPTTTCTVTGLPAPVDVTFTVTATSSTGTSAASNASNAVRTVVTAMEVPITPARIADSRSPSAYGSTVDGQYLGTGPITGGHTWTIHVAGRGGVPSIQVGAVVLNVTATNPTAPSHLRVYPSGVAMPNASNLNFVAGQTVANLVVSGLGADGSITIFNNLGATDVVVDVTGWYPAGNGYTSLVPARLLDTRPGGSTIDGRYSGVGALGPGATLPLPVTGRGGVPVGAGSVVLNVTVVDPTVAAYLTVYPTGSPRPNASNLNFVPGQTVANAVIAAVGTDGSIDLFNNAGSTQVVVDVVGWMPTVGQYHAISPVRLLDTRPGYTTVDHLYEGGGPIGTNRSVDLAVVGRATIPADAYAVVVNVTAVAPTVAGYLTVYPTGVTRPTASNLNFVPGQTVPNLVISGIGADGSISIYNANGATQVLVDVAGWYS